MKCDSLCDFILIMTINTRETTKIWRKDRDEHYGEGWKVGLRKDKTPTNSDKIKVDKNGKVIKKQKEYFI